MAPQGSFLSAYSCLRVTKPNPTSTVFLFDLQQQQWEKGRPLPAFGELGRTKVERRDRDMLVEAKAWIEQKRENKIKSDEDILYEYKMSILYGNQPRLMPSWPFAHTNPEALWSSRREDFIDDATFNNIEEAEKKLVQKKDNWSPPKKWPTKEHWREENRQLAKTGGHLSEWQHQILDGHSEEDMSSSSRSESHNAHLQSRPINSDMRPQSSYRSPQLHLPESLPATFGPSSSPIQNHGATWPAHHHELTNKEAHSQFVSEAFPYDGRWDFDEA